MVEPVVGISDTFDGHIPFAFVSIRVHMRTEPNVYSGATRER